MLNNLKDFLNQIITISKKLNDNYQSLINIIISNKNPKESEIENIQNNIKTLYSNLIELIAELDSILEKFNIELLKLSEADQNIIKEINEFLKDIDKKNKDLLELIIEANKVYKNKIILIKEILSPLKLIEGNYNSIKDLKKLSNNFSNLIGNKKIDKYLFKIMMDYYLKINSIINTYKKFQNKKKNKNIMKKIIFSGLGILSALSIGHLSNIFNSKINTNIENDLNNIKKEINKPIYSNTNKSKFRYQFNEKLTQDYSNNQEQIGAENVKPELKLKLKNGETLESIENIESIELFNPIFYDSQKKIFKKLYDEYYINDKLGYKKDYKNQLENITKILVEDELKVSKINPRLNKILKFLSKKNNISFKLVTMIALVESSYGKSNLSGKGALGPLQVLPRTMIANCNNEYNFYINKFGSELGEKKFLSDLYLQIIAGIKEIKNIGKQYKINMDYGIDSFNKYDLIVITTSYNLGRTKVRLKVKEVLNSETIKHAVRILLLNELVNRIK